MADSTTNLAMIEVRQAAKEVTANGLFDAGSGATLYGRRQENCIGLQWGYYGGRLGSAVVANGTVTLTASATNYLVVHRTTGVVSASTSAANWCTPETYARLYKVTTTTLAAGTYEDHRLGAWGILPAWTTRAPSPAVLQLRQGDASTAVTTGTRKAVTRAPERMLVTAIRASVATVSSSGAPAFDVNVGGQSIFATALTIDAGEKSSATAATPYTLADGADTIDDDEEVDLDIDTAGTDATGPLVQIIGITSRTSRYADQRVFALQGQGTNGSTTFVDISPRPKTITASGGIAITTSTAPLGGTSSIAFDGTNDHIDVSLAGGSSEFNFNGADFTIRVKIRHTGTSATPAALVTLYTATVAWGVFLTASTRALLVADSALGIVATSASNAVPVADTWYQLQITRSGGTLRVFVDGASPAISLTYNPPATGVLRLGLNAANTQRFTGFMRDIELLQHVATHTAAFTAPRRLMPAY
jgi:hypothetical protein